MSANNFENMQQEANNDKGAEICSKLKETNDLNELSVLQICLFCLAQHLREIDVENDTEIG